MDDVKLNWSTAEVNDAQLSVELEGKLPKGWKTSFEATAKLLGRGDWGEVRLKKHTVTVIEVSPGNEPKLRHHLEGIVEQANADHRPADEESADQGEHSNSSETEGEANENEERGPDAEMTGQFRSFGDEAQERP